MTEVTAPRNTPFIAAGYAGGMANQPSQTSLLRRLRERVLCALSDRPESILWPRRGAPRSLPARAEETATDDPLAGW